MKVKGKTEATRIFALLGDGAFKQTRSFIDLRRVTASSWERIEPRDWDAAESLRRECDRMNSAGLHRLYALYRERIAFFRQNPPPPDWDGSAEALGK